MNGGRRRFVAAAAGVGASALAGCSSLIGGGGNGSDERTVTATEPNDDGKGTVGELRYLIETKQRDGDIAIPVTKFVTGTGSANGEEFTYATATYDSQAVEEDSKSARNDRFVEEVGVFAHSYAVYVDADGDVTDFNVNVENRYDGQPERFGIQRKWARKYNSGEKDRSWYVNAIASTFEYPSTTTNESSTTANTSALVNKL